MKPIKDPNSRRGLSGNILGIGSRVMGCNWNSKLTVDPVPAGRRAVAAPAQLDAAAFKRKTRKSDWFHFEGSNSATTIFASLFPMACFINSTINTDCMASVDI